MQFFTIFAVLASASAITIPYKKCKAVNPNSEIISVDISPCKKSPCRLHQGLTYSLTVNFKSKTQSNSLKAKVCGKVGPVCIPFNLPNPDACKGQEHLTCPMEQDQEYTYTTSLAILPEYPKMKVTGKWNMVLDDGSDLLCFYMDLKISGPEKIRKVNLVDSNEISHDRL